MADQAERLRIRIKQQTQNRSGKTIAITSGKGGVGKSNFTINFALKLAELNKKVLIFDLDIGMGNIDILLGVTPRHSFVDLFSSTLSIHDIIESGPNALSYIAGGSGLSDLFQLDAHKFEYFQSEFMKLLQSYDFILFDMGAGLTNESLSFLTSANEVIIITTPEPTSIRDAYSVIKHLTSKDKELPIHITVNKALDDRDGRNAFFRIQKVAGQFLNKQVSQLGIIPEDRAVLKAVSNQSPFSIASPKCKASMAMTRIAEQFLEAGEGINPKPQESFLSKLKRLVLER
ncbi:MinD/ParA family protein [Halobacillus salinarum]|uniref:MinD/ParA family protein n=1 Tax=Halobacillus salinarum TaxID=2932257 RepID=A0ABY4EHS5_9BACI|nr:MinD/ParA family protein [Halobacillus salinarum]UOQ43037.1 MinD/ParA family protein [Halobacillus salinarum]